MAPISLNKAQLRLSPRSPFARRIWFALVRLGIEHDLLWTDTFQPTPEFYEDNPLGLIPSLRLPGVELPVADSNTILEILHETCGERIWPKDQSQKTRVRIVSTWAAGVMTATVNYFLESLKRSPDSEWRDADRETVARTLKSLESCQNELVGRDNNLTQAGWDVAVALQYLEFRISDLEWRKVAPGLEIVYTQALLNAGFVSTAPRA